MINLIHYFLRDYNFVFTPTLQETNYSVEQWLPVRSWSVSLLHIASVKSTVSYNTTRLLQLCKNINFYSCKWSKFRAALWIALIFWLLGLTVLQISVEIFLIALRYNLIFLLKEQLVLAIASFLTKEVISGTCCPGDVRCEAKEKTTH